MQEERFTRGQALYERHSPTTAVTVVRYTAHGLIEVKDAAGRMGFVHPDDALTAAEARARVSW